MGVYHKWLEVEDNEGWIRCVQCNSTLSPGSDVTLAAGECQPSVPEFTEERFEDVVSDVKAALDDGFQFADIAVLVEAATEFADLFALPPEKKKALAIRLMERVIDETDTPWLPDPLVDPLLKQVLPGLIELIIKATKGGLKVNTGTTKEG